MMIDRRVITDALKVMEALKPWLDKANRIPVFGNGGSASIANHMACDWMKGSNGRIIMESLCANTALLTAIGNDMGYDETCAAQIRWTRKHITNPVILISSSGSSKNIVKAAKLIRERERPLIAFTGFDGGPLKKLATTSVHIDSQDYGEIEDYHSQVMHEVARMLRRE